MLGESRIEEAQADEEVEEEAPSKCWLARRCICGVSGNLLFKFRNAVYKAMKKEFRPLEVDKRRMLKRKEIVMKITCKPLGVGGDEVNLLMEWWGGFMEFYLHISSMLFNPYDPWFHVMENVKGLPEAEEFCIPHGDETPLKASI